MSRFSGAFKSLVAFLGLAAVLLGALEHEALILQPEPVAGALATVGGGAAPDLLSPDADNGTEGTFRSEKHAQASPQFPAGRALSLPRDRRAGFGAIRIRPAETILRPRIVGVVILRL